MRAYQWRISRSASIEENLYSLGVMEQVAELNIEVGACVMRPAMPGA